MLDLLIDLLLFLWKNPFLLVGLGISAALILIFLERESIILYRQGIFISELKAVTEVPIILPASPFRTSEAYLSKSTDVPYTPSDGFLVAEEEPCHVVNHTPKIQIEYRR